MENQIITFAAILFLSLSFLSLHAQERTQPANQSEELGQVSWYRDYQTALKLAKEQDKKVLILFQEVPGCMTCRNYGQNVLSHPLMVEAIENEFIPLAIYNNKGGKDKQVLDHYGEPTWNNPVVRIVDHEGKNMVARVAGNYSAIGLYKAMENALKVSKMDIPEYMKLLGAELAATQSGKAKEDYYKMYCFWSGEKHFGANEGVLSTEAGFIGGSEVVKVTYDPQKIDESQLTTFAQKAQCTPIKNNGNYRTATNDVQYYLKGTNYKYLPLSPLQKTRINSALGSGKSAEKFLSPKQKEWLQNPEATAGKNKFLYQMDFEEAWKIKTNS